MEIKVKNFKILVSNSDETWCYSADIWVDGKPALCTRNSRPRRTRRNLCSPEVGWTMFTKRCCGHSIVLHEIDPKRFDNSPHVSNFEIWMGDYIEDHLKRKELRKLLNTGVVTRSLIASITTKSNTKRAWKTLTS